MMNDSRFPGDQATPRMEFGGGQVSTRGSDALAGPLSCRRARAVRGFLQRHGVEAARLQLGGLDARQTRRGGQPLDRANRCVEVRRLALREETP